MIQAPTPFCGCGRPRHPSWANLTQTLAPPESIPHKETRYGPRKYGEDTKRDPGYRSGAEG